MIRIILLSVITAFLLSACYSPSTYNAMVYSRDSLNLVSDSLKRVISARSTDILGLKQKISMLEQDTARLGKELRALNDVYAKMKSQSSDKTQELLSRIENLQNELAEKEKKIDEVNSKLKARENAMNELRNSLNNALLGFASSGLSVSVKDGKVYVSLSNQLLFQTGSTTIDKKGREALLGLAEVLNTQPDINILVEGHTDNQKVISQTRFKDNWDLSVLRATEVARYLTEDGKVDPKRIITSGRGEYFPLQEGDAVEARAANRRTEIILTPKMEEIFKIIEN